jgi:hypothetical protein
LSRTTAGIQTSNFLELHVSKRRRHISFFSLHRVPCSIPSLLKVTVRHYNGLQRCIQSNYQLLHSLLMHNIHCNSSAFPCPALDRRQAQDTLTRSTGLRTKQEVLERTKSPTFFTFISFIV